jgi:hypothetical protein
MNILILGSCITRDAFDLGNFKNDRLAHIHYFARTSLISLNTEPFNVDVNEIDGVNLFQKRLIASELNRDFYKYIATRDLSETYLIIDFLDERLDLMSSESRYLTLSQEYENSSLSSKIKGKKIPRKKIDHEFWKQNCRQFVDRIRQAFPPERIILHKAFWTENYAEGQEQKKFYNIDEIRAHNALLKIYYSIFRELYTESMVIDLSDRGFLADKNHRWGFSPVHFSPDYYNTFISEFNAILARRPLDTPSLQLEKT